MHPNTLPSLTVNELAALQASGAVFSLIDVRRAAVRSASTQQIAGAVWRNPILWLDWKDSIPSTQPAVVYCAKGHEIGQAMTACLIALGVEARYLEDGFAGWTMAGWGVDEIACEG